MAKENILTRSKKKQAVALVQANRLQDAKPLYKRITELDPLDAEAWFQLGVINEQSGHAAEAERCFRRAADIQPERAETHFHLAFNLELQGLHDAALACYRNGLEIKPDFAVAHTNMGLILEAQGKLDEAIACHREAVRLEPLAAAHNNLGSALRRIGHDEEAVSSYQAALLISPDFPDAHNNLGNLLFALLRYDEAAEHLAMAARLRPDAEVFFNLGNVYLTQTKLHQAVDSYSQALRLDPRYADAFLNMGTALGQLGQDDRALFCFREALKIDPDSVAALYNVGELLITKGQLDESLACFHRALQADPGFIKAQLGEVKVLDRRGDFEQAYARLLPLLHEDKATVDAALAFASLCRHGGHCNEAIVMMERLLTQQTPVLGSYERLQLHFELGRLLDAAAEYERAFEHFRQGNLLKDQSFSSEVYARHIDDLIATYSPDFMAHAPRARHVSTRPLFIVGMPRSGTSLVEQILTSHPQIAAGGELTVMNDCVQVLPQVLNTALPYPQCLAALTPESCDSLSQHYLDKIAEISPDARYVTDKMPANFKFLGLIALLFPGARIIHCVRDPLDTCLSCYFQHFSGMHPYAYDLGHLGSYYHQYQRLMRHWRAVIELPMLEIRYEDLVADQEQLSRELIAFCDLPWDERCLRFHETKRVVHTRSYDQVRQPLYQRAVGRWRHYERFIDPLVRRLSSHE